MKMVVQARGKNVCFGLIFVLKTLNVNERKGKNIDLNESGVASYVFHKNKLTSKRIIKIY